MTLLVADRKTSFFVKKNTYASPISHLSTLHELMAAALVWFPCTTWTNPSHFYFVPGGSPSQSLSSITKEHKNS